jgi:hypothetical protein
MDIENLNTYDTTIAVYLFFERVEVVQIAPVMLNIPVIDFLKHAIPLDTFNILQSRAISMTESLSYGRFCPL